MQLFYKLYKKKTFSFSVELSKAFQIVIKEKSVHCKFFKSFYQNSLDSIFDSVMFEIENLETN